MARLWVIINPEPTPHWDGPHDIAALTVRIEHRVVAGEGPFTRRKNGATLGRPWHRRIALRAFNYVIRTGGVGDVVSLRRGDGREVVRVREVQPSVSVININGNRHADECWTAVIRQFTETPIYFLGSYVCKYVAGSYTRSQHSYGNAVDFGSDSMDALHMIANWVVAHATELNVEHVIVADTAWTRGSGWDHYTGEYHYHCHVDFTPQYSGACGVRG